MTTLLPCPFCGGDAERVDNGPSAAQVQHAISWGQDVDDGGSFIHCKRCDASTALHFERRENLVSSWNERVVPVLSEEEALDRAEAAFLESLHSEPNKETYPEGFRPQLLAVLRSFNVHFDGETE